MNSKNLVVISAIVLALCICAVPLASDDSDGYIWIDGDISVHGFDGSNSGTLDISITNHEDRTILVTITAVDDDGDICGNGEFEIQPIDDGEEKITVCGLGVTADGTGNQTMTITVTPSDGTEIRGGAEKTVTFTVTGSVWDGIGPYIAIIIIALLVVIAVVLKMRSAPSEKPKTTFRDLEAGNDKPTTSKKEEKKVKSTERKMYDGNKEAAKEVPKEAPKATAPVEEKPIEKKTTFSDLEDARKKDAGEKKIKYVSSRRK